MIVGTEVGIIHRLRKENPGKKFIPASQQAICPRMKLITLENVLWSLHNPVDCLAHACRQFQRISNVIRKALKKLNLMDNC